MAAQRIAVDFLTVLRNQAREKLSAELVAQARRNLDLAQALDLASTQRPTLAAASAQVRVERLGLTAARLRRWATLAVSGTCSDMLAGSAARGHDYGLSAALSLKLWDGQARRAEVDSARAAWQSAGEQLLKDYPTGFETVHALRGVSFAVEPGEMVASMGPSGSGKSTMMNVLGLLDRATAGTYIDAGVDTIASSRAALLAK